MTSVGDVRAAKGRTGPDLGCTSGAGRESSQPAPANEGSTTSWLTRSLELLLPATVADTSLAYFREFLARESLRHPQAPSPTD